MVTIDQNNANKRAINVIVNKVSDNINFAGVFMIKMFVIVWAMGVVISVGFWQTLFAVLLPPYSLCVVVEFFMRYAGLLNKTAAVLPTPPV